MRNLRTLLAALAVSAMTVLSTGTAAQAQVVVYNHGHRVRVAHTLNNGWSSIKSGVRTGANTVSTATQKGWSSIKATTKSTTYRMTHRQPSTVVVQPSSTNQVQYYNRTSSTRFYRTPSNGVMTRYHQRMTSRMIRYRRIRGTSRYHRVTGYRAGLQRQR